MELIKVEPYKYYDGYFTFSLTYQQDYPDGSAEIWFFVDVPSPFAGCVDTKDVVVDTDKDRATIKDIHGNSMTACHFERRMIKPPTEPIELTMEDLEKEYGRPVKIIKKRENPDE